MKLARGGFLLLVVCLTFYPRLVNASQGPPLFAETPQAYWVFFTDKKDTSFDPYTFFHPAAIERRLVHGVSLYDTLDFPVREDYLQEVHSIVDSIRMVSRWLNAVRVQARALQVVQLENLPFVSRVMTYHTSSFAANLEPATDADIRLSANQLLQLIAQVSTLEGSLFHQAGFDGKGLRIAVFDGGFPGVDTHPVFRHLIDSNRIVKTWDFHRNREDVYRGITHGTMVLSAMAGIYDSIPMGLATGAEYLLARTEMWREPFFEEEYWLAAMEWADQHGAHIINSSLGYTHHRYFPEDMDGQTSLVAQATSIAFSKGILVVSSAGNSGGIPAWRIISTPGDSPHALTVGAISYPSLLRASYSSKGPTIDGRLKPNVVAIGNVIAASGKGFASPQGTSFSSPLVAGFAACLWQMFPAWKIDHLFDALQQSAHLHPYFDFDHGYGIPKASYFFDQPGEVKFNTFDFVQSQGQLKVVLRQINFDPISDPPVNAYVYYHIRNPRGVVDQYFVVLVEQQEVLSFDEIDFQPGQQVTVHYRGFTAAWNF